jgi:cell wall-associated NlpC family hydrolase
MRWITLCLLCLAWPLQAEEEPAALIEAVSEAPVIKLLSQAEQVAQQALSLLGIRYKYGGNLPEQGFDCSGLVRYVFSQVAALNLPRTAKGQSTQGESIALSELQIGDLVFFNTRRFAFSHVGIYLGDNQFLHAPSRNGVVSVENIAVGYWQKRFNGARRVL